MGPPGRLRVGVGPLLGIVLLGLAAPACLAGVQRHPVVALERRFAIAAAGLFQWRPLESPVSLPHGPPSARYELRGGRWVGSMHRYLSAASARYTLPAGVSRARVLALPLAHGILWTVRPASTLVASAQVPPPAPRARTLIAYTPYRAGGGPLTTGAITLGWLPRQWNFALKELPTAWIAPDHRARGVGSPAAAGVGPPGVPPLTGIRGHAVVTALLRVDGGAVIVLKTLGNAMTGMPGYLFLFRERARTVRPVTNFADTGGEFSWYATGRSTLVWDHGFVSGSGTIDQQFLLDLLSGQWWMTPLGTAPPASDPSVAPGGAVMHGMHLVVAGPSTPSRHRPHLHAFVPELLGAGN